jgi:hypothetical protein
VDLSRVHFGRQTKITQRPPFGGAGGVSHPKGYRDGRRKK